MHCTHVQMSSLRAACKAKATFHFACYILQLASCQCKVLPQITITFPGAVAISVWKRLYLCSSTGAALHMLVLWGMRAALVAAMLLQYVP